MDERLPPGRTVNEAAREQEIDRRLRVAFTTALHARHNSHGFVAISLGEAVVERLKGLAYVDDPSYAGVSPALWGFPVIEADPKLAPDHISVHDIQTIR